MTSLLRMAVLAASAMPKFKRFAAQAIIDLALLRNALTGGEGAEYSRFMLAERMSGKIYSKYKFSEFGRLFLEDESFLRYYESFAGTENYHSLDRKYTLDQLMKLVVSVEGDTAECGAYQGASSYLMCRHTAESDKKHHVFDSFEGLSKPHPEDGTYWKSGDLSTSEDAIRDNLKEFDNVVYHKGWIPQRFFEVEHERFSFVHLDVDLYQPTMDSLGFFYGRMNPGGIILCDDYGFVTCPGAKKAMDSFFADKPEEIVSLPTGQGFVVITHSHNRG